MTADKEAGILKGVYGMYKQMIKEISDFLDNSQEVGYDMLIINAEGFKGINCYFSDVLLKDTGLVVDSEAIIGRVFIPYNRLLGLEVL